MKPGLSVRAAQQATQSIAKNKEDGVHDTQTQACIRPGKA
ncbi:hypothetical protein PAMC26577_34675 [Caballeronia sordidicola]|jgi:hypothetical protein|uniref:Uncharacterized protein n=1 Tax=Caballeronia sordidicola TaxID=196367 RepID=A0A242MAB2_CABSO|nr:hypothetical protein PAMC26577_34675 [Caballeronia sordidicola]